MCGVVSIVYGKHNENLGNEGVFLLKKLEYRGYDSTGGAFLEENGTVMLKKKIGAPSRVTVDLEMDKASGVRFIGQVRWATYGSVTNENAQPHDVNCNVHLVGGHNGNISNTDTLKEFLTENGHTVASNNDGEMLVHVVEHFYDRYLGRLKSTSPNESTRIKTFIKAIRKAEDVVEGSYAACVTAPDITGVFAMKSGSSLYAGKGDDDGGPFIVVSSDLTSVLSKTRFLVPLAEGEGLYFTSTDYKVFSLAGNKESVPALTRSRLNISDIALAPKYSFFMEQEIYSASQNLDILSRYYFSDDREKPFFDVFEKHLDKSRELLYALLNLYTIFDSGQLKKEFESIRTVPAFKAISSEILQVSNRIAARFRDQGFTSEEAALLNEILGIDEKYLQELFILDQMLIWKKKRMIVKYKEQVVESIKTIARRGGRIFVVASGTSGHAALIGGYFFNTISQVPVIPAIPGLFRSVYLHSLSDKDMVIGVSQSGETKDLVDIFNDLRELYGKKLTLFTIVNNENSTLPLEKSDFYLPVMCGPEIAVAATKSFISQMALFYILACSVNREDDDIRQGIAKMKYYMELTLQQVDPELSSLALRLFLRPSMHILGTSLEGLSKEAALKVREVVLNHTEGYDSAEFKHGPNTLLGKNTIFSLKDMERLHTDLLETFERLLKETDRNPSNRAGIDEFLTIAKNLKLKRLEDNVPWPPLQAGSKAKELHRIFDDYKGTVSIDNYFSNYPLIFVCPPDERDRRITITQIHTHKIRGADIILIAEEDEQLRKAVEGKPAAIENYYHNYIRLPKTGDRHIFVFQAALAFQLLALKMSVNKMKYLNNNQVENHGVHPDVPKNVSKSITVD
ncbi:MAG: SIS domain-containing protein [bacterium]|nr:SIS domain-containing protein [bacterium]